MVRVNLALPEHIKYTKAIEKRKHVNRGHVIEFLSGIRVNVGSEDVNVLLPQVVKRGAFREDSSNELMI